ncbi:hypothetical protein P3T27_000134 [Kitasatospora sp. MAA19]|uniref:hypothetical protein n=1 Tax=unclassified Kitasatospora TaxID=2633591 RepID=UPI0024750F44|nr:hypothetical protein [Kitasatospora sp. MAA19]MDH6703453.1 hypothetical protein [Kitasatospora sp. MAA19]
MRHYRWVLETQDDDGRWSRRDGAPMPDPLEYDGPPQRAANHLRDVFVRTLSLPAPGPRAIRIRLWDGADIAGRPQAEAEWSRE